MFLARATARALGQQHATAAAAAGRVSTAAAAAAAIRLSGASAASAASASAPRRCMAFSYPTPRTLDEIVKLPLLIPHSREEVAAIWGAHHAQSHNAATAADDLTATEHDTFLARAKKAPLFVVPCFKIAAESASTPNDTFDVQSGFEMMLVNVQQSSLLLTSLEEYKSRGAAAATPYAVVTLYADMAASKDLVLVRAEMMDVNVAVPQLMAMWTLLKALYTNPDATLFERFPRAFNKKPNPQFDFEAYVAWCKEECAKISLPRTQFSMPAAAAAASDTPAAEFVEVETAPKQQ